MTTPYAIEWKMKKEIVYAISNSEAAPAARKVHRKMFELVERRQPRSVLEIGSGTGLLGAQIASSGIDYKGIEPVDSQFDISRQRFPNLNFTLASCYDDPKVLGLGRFDMVISNDVIEHLYVPRKLVTFAKAHLKPGGTVITCTPDFGSYIKNMAYSVANKWDYVHSPLWDGGHIKFFSRKTLRQLFEESGFGNFSWDYVRGTNMIFNMSIICTCALTAE